MRVRPWLFALVLGAACGGAPAHVADDGSYGFDGDGWAPAPANTDGVEEWTKAGTNWVLFATVTKPVPAATALAWAEDELAIAQMNPDVPPPTFQPEPFPTGVGAWVGFACQGAGFQYYRVDDDAAIRVTLYGEGLTRDDAVAVLATVRTLE